MVGVEAWEAGEGRATCEGTEREVWLSGIGSWIFGRTSPMAFLEAV